MFTVHWLNQDPLATFTVTDKCVSARGISVMHIFNISFSQLVCLFFSPLRQMLILWDSIRWQYNWKLLSWLHRTTITIHSACKFVPATSCHVCFFSLMLSPGLSFPFLMSRLVDYFLKQSLQDCSVICIKGSKCLQDGRLALCTVGQPWALAELLYRERASTSVSQWVQALRLGNWLSPTLPCCWTV